MASYTPSVQEKRRVYKRAYYAKNREKVLIQGRAARLRRIDKARAESRRYHETHREEMKALNLKRALLRDAFRDAAMAGGCVDCGEKNLNVLDLDHVRGIKVKSVSMMGSAPLDKVFAEIDKCETRCANCHRLVTVQRRKAKRG